MEPEEILKHKDKCQAKHLLAEENSVEEKTWEDLANTWDILLEYVIEFRKEEKVL